MKLAPLSFASPPVAPRGIAPLVVVAAAFASAAPAAELEPGAALYQENCAVCHGVAGHGDGPAAATVKAEVPDLTRIAARRGGAFPFLEVFDIVRGYAGGGTHARRTMPFTGHVFALGGDGDPDSVLARARMLELTYYLSQIQQE